MQRRDVERAGLGVVAAGVALDERRPGRRRPAPRRAPAPRRGTPSLRSTPDARATRTSRPSGTAARPCRRRGRARACPATTPRDLAEQPELLVGERVEDAVTGLGDLVVAQRHAQIMPREAAVAVPVRVADHASDCREFLRNNAGMTRRLAEVAAQGRGQRGDRQPGAQRQARASREATRAGGAHRARRPRLRAADQAARRARPARRPGPARAAEPDLPGVRRGGRRRARAAGLHAGAVHPDRRRRHRGGLRRAAAPAAGVGRRLRRRPLRAGATRRTSTTSGSPSATCPTVLVNAADRRRSASRGCRATTRSPSSRRSGHLRLARPHAHRAGARARSTTCRRSASSPPPSAIAERVGHRAAGDATSCARCTRSRRAGRGDRLLRGRRHRASSAPATRWRSARSAPPAAPGCSVPDDVSVVGYDDSALMNCTEPPLTTVRQPIEPMGRMVIELLVGQIDGARRRRTTSCSSSPSSSCAARPDRAPARRPDRPAAPPHAPRADSGRVRCVRRLSDHATLLLSARRVLRWRTRP